MMVTGMDDDQTCVRERERGWEVVCIRRFFSCDGRLVGWLVGRVGLFVLFYGIIKRGGFFFSRIEIHLGRGFLGSSSLCFFLPCFVLRGFVCECGVLFVLCWSGGMGSKSEGLEGMCLGFCVKCVRRRVC